MPIQMQKVLYPAVLCALVWTSGIGLCAQEAPRAVVADPAVDKEHPASMQSFQIPSHGEKMNAIAYLAAGAEAHPLVLLLHGFPGNEKNLDLAQAIRRAGWNVVFFNYRGSWGTPGSFSFGHAVEDTAAAVAYLREPANAARLHSDASRIVVIGHSMGGFMAAYEGSHDKQILATGMISAANMYTWAGGDLSAEQEAANKARLARRLIDEDILPLAGCSGESLAEDMLAHRKEWNFLDYTAMLGTRPLLVLTSNDGLAQPAHALVVAMQKVPGSRVTEQHLATDHSYSDQRIALASAVVNWLATLR